MVEDPSVQIFHEIPLVYEKKVFNLNHLPLAILIGFSFVFVFILLMFLFSPDLSIALVIALVFVIVYSVILFFLLEPRMMRQVNQKEIHHHTIEKPVQVPVEVIRTVEKPVEVIRHVPIEHRVEVIRDPPLPPPSRTVYLARPLKKLNIPHYDYVASTETKTYHKSSCRFSKLIKRKYKESNNDPKFFKKKGYSPCEVCVTKKVKA